MANFYPLALLLALLGLPTSLHAADEAYPRPELLLEPTELAQPAVAEKFIVLDARPADEYARAHIPQARWVDHAAWKAAVADGKDAAGWSRRIGQLGIDADAQVVVYDDNSMKDAARIWWILRYWGVENVRLLNGGWKTWQALDLPTASGPSPTVEAASFQAEPHTRRLMSMEQILPTLASGSLQIVDARSEDEHCGRDDRARRSGAIPGAKHLEWSDLIDGQTDRFKSAAELRRLFEQANIDLTQPTASHCQSGGRASVMAFGLELMGAKDVRNYYRGWSEWGNAADAPINVAPSAK